MLFDARSPRRASSLCLNMFLTGLVVLLLLWELLDVVSAYTRPSIWSAPFSGSASPAELKPDIPDFVRRHGANTIKQQDLALTDTLVENDLTITNSKRSMISADAIQQEISVASTNEILEVGAQISVTPDNALLYSQTVGEASHAQATLGHSFQPDDHLPDVTLDSVNDTNPPSEMLAEDPLRYALYSNMMDLAASLPDVVHIPFEEAVEAEVLAGWEDRWLTDAVYDDARHGPLTESKVDFVYTWVNGSDPDFRRSKSPFELNSTLNSGNGEWLTRHGANRYRDWEELRYSLRSVEKHAHFRNRIQILVNSVTDSTTGTSRRQRPAWLHDEEKLGTEVQVLAQEDFFEESKFDCLPSFNSLTIESQIHNTKSNVDILFAMSDDMLLGKQHAPSDIYSPLFGPGMGFKTNAYNTRSRPTEADAHRFGEKPWLIYTSWLLNRRFGPRKRKGQVHFGHALSRNVMREAMNSFPRPNLNSACSRFRGDQSFQLYGWYNSFHYLIERNREAMLWSYLMLRSDVDRDGYLSWQERKVILDDLADGMQNEAKSSFRTRNFYHVPDMLEKAGLEAPLVNTDILWTSLDGPVMIKDIECHDFDVNDCLAPGFSTDSTDSHHRSPVFAASTVFDRVARQEPTCGDCLIKILLHRVEAGLGPILPHMSTQMRERDLAVKALMRYKYQIIAPDGLFVMVTDAEQVESTLIKRLVKRKQRFGQMCLNDDVDTDDDGALQDLQAAMTDLYTGLFPRPSKFERASGAK